MLNTSATRDLTSATTTIPNIPLSLTLSAKEDMPSLKQIAGSLQGPSGNVPVSAATTISTPTQPQLQAPQETSPGKIKCAQHSDISSFFDVGKKRKAVGDSLEAKNVS
jgi:hypothetical protein